IQTDAPRIEKTLQSCLAGTLPGSTPNGPLIVVPRVGLSGLPLYVVAENANIRPTTGVLAVLDDRDSETGTLKHRDQWRDWLRWSNILQFLKFPRNGEVMPLRMVEVWTRQSAYEFSEVDIPLSVPAPGRVDGAFALPGGWAEVLHFSNAILEELIIELARLEVPIPEPGFHVGPASSLWHVELAWPAYKLAVVIEEEPLRDAWLTVDGWAVGRLRGRISPASVADFLWKKLGVKS
ncbi:MAG: hypothetical protein WCN98_19190, partial [Verrucomicrobiaceae bacterium]